jgi:hypothetical protein
MGAVDFAHSTGADRTGDFVRTDTVAGGQCHSTGGILPRKARRAFLLGISGNLAIIGRTRPTNRHSTGSVPCDSRSC